MDPQSVAEIEATVEQELVNSRFSKVASNWTELYELQGIYEFIFQERLRVVLDMVRNFGLPAQTRVLDVGCGGGFGTLALAEMGLLVDAIDPVPAMIDMTRERVNQGGQGRRVRTNLGDVHALSFADETFGLVLALGVLPWMSSIEQPLQEMCRVLQPGGYLIFTVNNRWALRSLLEPLMNPLLNPAKELAKRVTRRRPKARLHLISRRQCDALLDASGLVRVETRSLGFGPFTVFGHHLLRCSLALKLHAWLQSAANRSFPVLRSSGTWWLICARCPDGTSTSQRC